MVRIGDDEFKSSSERIDAEFAEITDANNKRQENASKPMRPIKA